MSGIVESETVQSPAQAPSLTCCEKYHFNGAFNVCCGEPIQSPVAQDPCEIVCDSCGLTRAQSELLGQPAPLGAQVAQELPPLPCGVADGDDDKDLYSEDQMRAYAQLARSPLAAQVRNDSLRKAINVFEALRTDASGRKFEYVESQRKSLINVQGVTMLSSVGQVDKLIPLAP